jgi:hypothetical protein
VSNLVYEEPPDATVGQVRAALAAGEEPSHVSTLLVGAALHQSDWRNVQELCLELLDGENAAIAATSVTCLGHLARLHGQIDKDRVIRAIKSHEDNPVIRKRIQDALDDIEMFS